MMTYPDLNPYISDINQIVKIDPIAKNDDDYRLINSESGNIYYLKKGNTFDTYNSVIFLHVFLESLKNINPDIYILILLYIGYITRIKKADIYMMQLATINIFVRISTFHIKILIDGCSPKIDEIIKTVMDWYFNPNSELNNIDLNVYEMIYHDIMINLLNYRYSNAYLMVVPEFIKMINDKYTISNEESIVSLQKFSPENMKNKNSKINFFNFRKSVIELISCGNIIGLFGGSISIRQTNKIIDFFDKIIKKENSNSYKICDIIYELDKKSLSQKKIVYNMNPNNNEASIGYAIYLGNMKNSSLSLTNNKEINWELLKSLCTILNTYISDKFMTMIRTENEIGYIALTSIINVNEINNPDLFLIFIVQSSRDDLEEIVKDYIDNHLLSDIQSMTEEEFDSMKQSLITNLSEKSINIDEDISEKYNLLIKSNKKQDGKCSSLKENYDKKDKLIKSLKSIKNKDILIKFVEDIMKKNIRSVLSVLPVSKYNQNLEISVSSDESYD
jgi:hypothetical protein